ncbi:hypothetical protein BSKO_04441 [Bryopsis sp. KO-2023]|nr:hypothetical protein BSKO_04441 [Bryopsis sp. KO-2023]
MTKIRLGKKFGDVWSTEDIHALWLSENHSRNVHQGTGVYNTKCKELGLTVNTKVLQNLLHAHCDLSGCDLGRKGSQAVASAISSNMVISTLDISKNQIDGKSLGVLVRGILTSIGHAGGFLADGEKQKIKEVKVVSKSKWKKLAEVSTKPAVGFEKLNAAMNKLNDVSARIKASQAQKTGLNGNLHDLILAENPLGFPGALLLSNCLNPARIRREFLTTLDLTKCNIPDQGGKVLAEALGEGNILLNTLKLPHNMIGDGTAKAFARLFEFNHTLLHLDLSWNLIKQDGARALARGLQSNATLQQLNLAWNGIESKGVMFMGEMLQVNLGLKHLDMSSTRAGPDSCLVIAEGLKMNNVLEVLLLDNNPVGEGGARHLMLAMGCNASIKYLGLQSSITANASPQSDSQLNIASNFDISSPDNHYVLNLSVPAERAVALQLCQMDQRSSSNLMRNIKHGDTSVESAKKAGWPDRLPDSGRLVADFVTTMDPVHIKVFTEKQLLPLLPQFSKKMMLDTDKLGLTSMVCPHYYFKCDQIAKILVNFGMGDAKVFAAAAFMSRAVDVEENKKMIYDCLSDRDLHQLSRELGFYKHFTPHNPTGMLDDFLSIVSLN